MQWLYAKAQGIALEKKFCSPTEHSADLHQLSAHRSNEAGRGVPGFSSPQRIALPCAWTSPGFHGNFLHPENLLTTFHHPPTTFDLASHQLQYLKISYWNSTTPAVAYVSSTALLNLQHSAPPPSAISFPRPLAPAYSVVLVLAQFHAFDLFTEALISSSGSATYFFLRWRNPNCTQYPQQMRTMFRNDFLNCLSEINTITTQCFHLPKLAQCFSARTFSNVCSLNHLG